MSAESDVESDRAASAARARLDGLMTERVLDLDLLWKDVADRAGMTYGNLHKIRSGATAITDRAKRGIERALQWRRGSVDAILAGGDPTPIQMQDPPRTEKQRALRVLLDRYLREHEDDPQEALRLWRRDVAIAEQAQEDDSRAG